jgi:hypothetical protein
MLPGARHLCALPVREESQMIPRCLQMIEVDHVVEAVMSYYEAGMLPPIGKPTRRYDPDQVTNLDVTVDQKVERVLNGEVVLVPPEPAPAPVPGFVPLPPLKLIREPSVPPKPQAALQTIQPQPIMPKIEGVPQSVTHPIVGGRYTVFVLCYGKHLELARRCIDSIVRTMPKGTLDLRVGCNACDKNTLDYVRTQPITKLYVHPQNDLKYPVMREMFHDPECPIGTNYVIWFDDDSFVVDPNWLDKLSQTIIDNHPHGSRLYGIEFLHDIAHFAKNGHDPRGWFEAAGWHNSQPMFAGRGGRFTAANGSMIRFASGGFWALATDVIRLADIPDSRVKHSGGDITIGAQVHQAGWKVKAWNTGKIYVHSSGADPRGASKTPQTKRFPWQEGGEDLG